MRQSEKFRDKVLSDTENLLLLVNEKSIAKYKHFINEQLIPSIGIKHTSEICFEIFIMIAGGDIFTKGVTIGMEVTAYEEVFTQDIKKKTLKTYAHTCARM